MLNSFPKSQRLKSRKKLQQLFDVGKSIRNNHIRLVYLIEEGKPDVKCGVGANSRFFKRAVDRNRIKRLLREVYRVQQHSIKEFTVNKSKSFSVFILYTGKQLPVYTDLYDSVGIALQKLLAVANATGTKNT